jgi:phosphatidylinositol-4,5-bisphosphate 3-kinase
MERSFRLKLVGIESLSSYYNNLKQLMTKTDSFEDGRLYFYVTAGIYHGGSLLVPVVFSQMVQMSSNPRWYQWFNFAIKMRDLPRAARVCFTLYARPPKGEGSRDVPIGWVNCQLFNFKHELRTGIISLNMYRDDKANPIGTCVPNAISNAATLFVEFDSYKLPVVFPTDTSESSEDPQDIAKKANEIPPNGEELNVLMSKDPLFPYSDSQRELIWQNRYYFLSHPKTLPKVLASVNSSDRFAVQEMKRLLDVWIPLPPIEALELLDSRFTEAKIREHAVEWIDVLPDEELIDYLLQLVQVLKYEPYHDSALARFLVRRALWSSRVGHSLFWYLKSEMHVQEISERYGLLLEAYLFGSGRFLSELKKQDDLMGKLVTAANSIKAPVKESERKDVLLEHLRKIEFPSKVSLPLNPSLEANGIMVDSCKYMDSKKLPLWVVLKNSDTNGSPIYIIFKSGDDLRQDMLTLQMIRIMDKLWKKEGLDLQMSPYGCISTGDEVGMIEVVLNADTTASISKRAGGATAAFYVDPLAKWLQKHNPESQYEKAVEVFIKSCAGYCVATYVLGIGDRHNDNVSATFSLSLSLSLINTMQPTDYGNQVRSIVPHRFWAFPWQLQEEVWVQKRKSTLCTHTRLCVRDGRRHESQLQEVHRLLLHCLQHSETTRPQIYQPLCYGESSFSLPSIPHSSLPSIILFSF